MSLASLSSAATDLRGRTALVPTTELFDRMAEAERAGFLAVTLRPPGPSERGQLAVVIEEAIEACLTKRGACGPGIGAAADLDGSLSDQLYRARLVEMRGLVLGVPALDGIATLAGTLDPEDSAVLRWWLRAAEERPVHVYLDETNRYLGVYGRPVPLHELLSRREGVVLPSSEAPPAVAPEVARSIGSMDLAPPVSADPAPVGDELEDAPATPDPEPASDLVAALLAELVERHSEEVREAARTDALPSVVEGAAPAREAPVVEAPVVEAPVAVSERAEDQPGARAPVGDPAAQAEPPETPQARLVHSEEGDSEPVLSPPLRPAHGPLNGLAAELWPGWVRELEGARGPKPLAAVERMFVTSYVPLRDALMRGIAEPRASAALEAWATSFAQSYKEAFAALCVRGKRPTMVLDVPDLALRIARLHGARSVQLVLVDGMRFDLGLRIEQQLRALLGNEVALTERLLLWSALPANTSAQLELLGRGPEALREWSGSLDSDVPVARGRNAATPRRIKVGHRELMKLDIVEAKLGEPGADEARRLDALADETADALANYIGRLPARTLVMVFGDHGFLLDPLDGGTAPARQGGTRPEEVLVPAFAWLIGGLH